MSQSNLQTDQARARWAAEYREARKVRHFEHDLLSGNLSSIGYAAPRCVALGGVPRVVRIERGSRLGEIHDVQCRDLPEGGPTASDTTWIAL